MTSTREVVDEIKRNLERVPVIMITDRVINMQQNLEELRNSIEENLIMKLKQRGTV